MYSSENTRPLSDFTRGSNHVATWVCQEGHTWDASIKSVHTLGSGCPYCSGRRAIAGVNDLATARPEVAKWWSPRNTVLPSELKPSSHAKVYVICPVCGDERREAVPYILDPHCKAHRAPNAKPTTLTSSLVAQLVDSRNIPSPTSSNDVSWKCEHGHVWESSPKYRMKHSKCPVCAGTLVVKGVNDLATTHPSLSKMMSPDNTVSPSEVTYGSNRKVKWVCHKGHPRITRVALFVRHPGCPVCEGRVKTADNDLASLHPHLAQEWDTEENGSIAGVAPGSDRVVWWECTAHNHRWEQSVYKRAVRGYGCPYCTGKRVLTGFNDIATTHPDLAAQWLRSSKGSPTTVSAGSDVCVSWRCPTKGHVWETTVAARVSGKGCPTCAGYRIELGYNDLFSLRSDLAAEWSPQNVLLPTHVTLGSNKVIEWVCADGHVWDATVVARVNGGGCPVCSNTRVDDGVNDLATTHPDLAKQWHSSNPKQPHEIHAGSTYRAVWQCTSNVDHLWDTSVRERTGQRGKRDATGCPLCARHVSRGETELTKFVQSVVDDGVEVRTSDRTQIGRMELDIYVPSSKIAVEFNGVYWHTDTFGKDSDYHKRKLDACRSAGISLVQVWEDDWRDKRPVVESMLRNKFGADVRPSIGARKCTVTALPYLDAKYFLDANHVQGSARGAFYDALVSPEGNVVAVMVTAFQRGNYRIERYATSVRVPGGFTRLLSVLRKRGSAPIVTFSDNEISDGALYSSNGFVRDGDVPPDYRYFYKGRRRHKFGFRLKRFRTDAALTYVDGLTERELAELNGIPRCWDSGKVRWVLR